MVEYRHMELWPVQYDKGTQVIMICYMHLSCTTQILALGLYDDTQTSSLLDILWIFGNYLRTVYCTAKSVNVQYTVLQLSSCREHC